MEGGQVIGVIDRSRGLADGLQMWTRDEYIVIWVFEASKNIIFYTELAAFSNLFGTIVIIIYS